MPPRLHNGATSSRNRRPLRVTVWCRPSDALNVRSASKAGCANCKPGCATCYSPESVARPSAATDFLISKPDDAQAPGVARLVRQAAQVALGGQAGQRTSQRLLDRLAELHLLTRAFARRGALSDAERADLGAALGLPVRPQDLENLPTVDDVWQVVAVVLEQEDLLRSQACWMFGTVSRRAVLLLQFAHGTAAFPHHYVLGTEFAGELAVYPGHGTRGMMRTKQPDFKAISQPGGYATCDEALDALSQRVADCVWLERLCLPLVDVVPTKDASGWHVIDRTGASLPLTVGDEGFLLLALSGGAPLQVVVEFERDEFRPRAVACDGRWYLVSSQMEPGYR